MAKITGKTTLQDALRIKDADEILNKFQVPCLHCSMAAFEMGQLTIGDIANMYGLKLKDMLHDLNDKVNRDRK